MILEKLGTKIYEVGSHTGWVLQWKDLQVLVSKWKYNRDPDSQRVAEMVGFYRSGGYVPLILHIAEIGGKYYCYDGNHRREMLQTLDNPDLSVVIDLLSHATDSDVHSAFNAVNQSVQVPDLYLQAPESNRKISTEQIVELVREYERKYKGLVSTSSRYHAPNFNRDVFVDSLGKLVSDNPEWTPDDLRKKLQRWNDYLGIHLTEADMKPVVYQKCKDSGLWIWYSRQLDTKKIEKI